MNISLTPHFEEMVKNKVDSGLYHSASEVVRDALRLMEERDKVHEFRLEELRKEIRLGIESGSAGVLDMEEIKREARDRHEEKHRKPK